MGVSKSLFISPSSVLCAQFLSLEALPPILLLSVSLSFFPLLRSQPEPTEICGLPGRHHRERIEYVTCESAWLSDRPAGRGKPSQRCSRSGALPLFLAPCDGGRSPSLSLPCRCAAPPPSTSSPSPLSLSLPRSLLFCGGGGGGTAEASLSLRRNKREKILIPRLRLAETALT